MKRPQIPLEVSIQQLQQQLKRGAITSEALVQHYLERIEQFDAGKLNSVRQTNPAALEIARGLDAERKNGATRGALHGVPVLVKDNINTADSLETTAGSLTLQGSKTLEDAFLIIRLREAGAVILGKTNMTEWANFTTTGMPNGYSSLGGQVRNPYGDFDTGGSSSGSGVSIATDLAVVAVGTETSGSILSPSVSNSLVGIKPTVGLISRTGIIPIAASQDTAGPMARCVADAAVLLSAMAGRDPLDSATKGSRVEADYTKFLEKDGLRSARIGVPRAHYWDAVTPDQRPILEAALIALQDCGATLIENADISTAKAVSDAGYAVLVYEFKRDLNNYLRHLKPPYPRTLLEVIRANEQNFATHLRYGQTLLLAAQAASGTRGAYYQHSRAEDLRLAKLEGIDATMQQHNLDALFMPMYWGAQIGAKAGYPTITVPAGYDVGGQPVGISLLGSAYSEGKLIQYGYAYEQATKTRKSPLLEVD